MKKILLVFVLAAILATGTVFADHPDGLGVGVLFNFGFTGTYGAALSLKLPNFPIYWGVSIDAHTAGDYGYLYIGAIGDHYIFDRVLVKDINMHWYFGLGGWARLYSQTYKNASANGFGLGARVPFGLSWQIPFPPTLEVFIDIAPTLGVVFWGEGKVDDYVYQEAGAGFAQFYPLEIGVRIWL